MSNSICETKKVKAESCDGNCAVCKRFFLYEKDWCMNEAVSRLVVFPKSLAAHEFPIMFREREA